MKVLFLADGRSVHSVRYQKEMKKAGVEIILASLERGDTVDIGLPTPTGINSLDYILAGKKINRLIRELTPDIINPHFASGYGFATALSGVWKKKPVLLNCLGSDILLSPSKSMMHKKRVVYALSHARHIIVDSRYLGDKVREIYSTHNISIIPWGVEDSFLEVFDRKVQSGFKFNFPLKVLIPRPHNRIYNNRFIIESLRDFINEGKVTLTFPGWGEDYEAFRREAKELCARGMINYYEFMGRAEYADFISGFDIYLSAALSDSSPASLIEAMAAGLFPAVADIPGVRDWVNHDNCVFFNPYDIQSLKRAFEILPGGQLPLQDILKRNHDSVRAKGLFSQNIKETINIMEQLVGDGVE
jgi:glycosyltransferase involved in cell wall biosynthesis